MAAVAFAAPSAFAAKGGNGKGGGGSTVKIAGTVTNSLTGAGVHAKVTFTNTDDQSFEFETDSSGRYSGALLAGIYSATATTHPANDDNFPSDPNYNDKTTPPANFQKGGPAKTVNIALSPIANVVVSARVIQGTTDPGNTVTVEASYKIYDGSTVDPAGTGWVPTQGLEAAAITDPFANPTQVTLAPGSDYAAYLIELLKEPPIKTADLPPDLVLQPINEVQKGLQDRNQVVAINPMAHEEAAEFPIQYQVTTDTGDVYFGSVSAAVELPWPTSTGVRTVSVNVPVLLYAKDAASYSWTLAKPGGSGATLTDADTQTPSFTPDREGLYLAVETSSGAELDVYADRYHGVIQPDLTLNNLLDGEGNYNGDGRPEPDPACTSCHTEGGAAPANFDTWRLTGHAEAFTQGITTNGHFGENCFACHAVGFGTTTGIDSTEPNYSEFLADLSHAQHTIPPTISGLWVSMLENQPDTARLSNIQCESCHGPQALWESHPYDASGSVDGRVSLASDVCGSCHGEPARHGRFQQWLLSNHADYDLARSRGAGGHSPENCGRCHSGNGFVDWSKHDFDPTYQYPVSPTNPLPWDNDTVVPQTCQTCHDPHDTGTTSGSDETNAKVRVNAGEPGACGDPSCDTNMLTAGFVATTVGKGATCMTCHNSRAEVPRNDATWASLSDPQKTGGPHHGVQADLIMGQNMYFTGNVPIPGKHATIEDVCVTCHMNATQPPDILSYNQAGTNHTFAADPGICVECHGLAGETLAETVDNEITGYMGELAAELSDAFLRVLTSNYPVAAGGGCNPADGTAGHEITAVTWNYGGHSGATLDITVSDGSSCTGRSLSSIQVDGGASSLVNFMLDPLNGAEALLKARWNYGLNYEDETINGCVDADDPNCDPPHTHRGVHNHAFSQAGLLGAISAVQAVAP